MTRTEQKKILTGGVVALLAYFGIIKPVLTKLGVFKSKELKDTENRKNLQLEDQIKNFSKTEKLTKTIQEWQVIADQIYNDLRYTAISDNKDDAGYQVSRVKNTLDFWQLYKLFGKRREYVFGVPSGSLQDLSQFIRSNLSAKKIEQINKNYLSKKIKFQF